MWICCCVMNFLLLVCRRVQYESKVRETDKSRKISDPANKHDSRYYNFHKWKLLWVLEF